jgi:hypothetical protein
LETSDCPNYQGLREDTCFGCKEDGSISGKEFISPVLSSNAGLEEVRSFLRQAKHFSVDEKCGYHLHLDARNLDVTTLKRVCIAYLRTQALWQSFVPNSRRTNRYCDRIEWNTDDIQGIDTLNQFRLWAGNLDRYRWFNVASYAIHLSLEVRLHTSTLHEDKVCNWIKAHCRFVDWIANGGDINRFVGTLPEQFAVLREIWADDELADFYLARAAKWGTDLAPLPLPLPLPLPTSLFDLLEVT